MSIIQKLRRAYVQAIHKHIHIALLLNKYRKKYNRDRENVLSAAGTFIARYTF